MLIVSIILTVVIAIIYIYATKKTEQKSFNLFEISEEVDNSPILEWDLNDQNSFVTSYKRIVGAISDSSGITSLRINKNVPENQFFTIKYTYYDAHVQLIYRLKDFYLLGFIGKNNVYYYFSDSNLTTVPNASSSQNLGYSGSYIVLGLAGTYAHKDLTSYISQLSSFDGSKATQLKKALSIVIFSTAEALRFKTVAVAVTKIIGSHATIDSSKYEQDIKNWQSLSNKALNKDASTIKIINIAKKY